MNFKPFALPLHKLANLILLLNNQQIIQTNTNEQSVKQTKNKPN